MSQRAVHTSRSHLLCHQPGPSPAHPWPTADRRAQTRAHTHKPCAHFLNETPHVGNKYCIVSLSLSLSLSRQTIFIHQTSSNSCFAVVPISSFASFRAESRRPLNPSFFLLPVGRLIYGPSHAGSLQWRFIHPGSWTI